MTKNPRITALRMAAKAFLIIAAGGHLLPEEGKTFAGLVPPCDADEVSVLLRLQELDEISNSVKGVLHVERHPEGCECDRCAAWT